MSEHFDAIVIGMGPGGEVAASQLLRADKRVAVIERELIGGECGYWACIPSKTLLRLPEAKGEVDRAEGVAGAQLDWPSTRDHRDVMIRHLDDCNHVKGYEKAGATVVKGAARITGKGQVEVDGRTLTADHLIIATGSEAFIPPIDGLDSVPFWTNREATTLTEIPPRAVMIGGSAVGAELGLFLRRYGAQDDHPRALRATAVPRGPPTRRTEHYLREEGVDVRTGTSAVRARKDGEDTVVELDSGDEVRCDVVIVGTGRTPRAEDLDWSRSASSWASAARSWWTTTAGPVTACGRSATSLVSCPSPMSRCTWPASSPTTSPAETAPRATTASRGWSSPIPKSPRSAPPPSRHSKGHQHRIVRGRPGERDRPPRDLREQTRAATSAYWPTPTGASSSAPGRPGRSQRVDPHSRPRCARADPDRASARPGPPSSPPTTRAGSRALSGSSCDRLVRSAATLVDGSAAAPARPSTGAAAEAPAGPTRWTPSASSGTAANQ